VKGTISAVSRGFKNKNKYYKLKSPGVVVFFLTPENTIRNSELEKCFFLFIDKT